ncbi:glutamic-type intramembrane protease PrsW [Microaerobacter geothermalis]|uniref:glutamic-type intramembrane protease PrsW n=1 Tax=Microaerobacter geothermalis TaxID=674972 RepID=UPI001F34290B|nr:glutamic-type intramembrane protease PrsW [Microaerobacter geothermalis]MCF6093515.1 glutamic-type intramembrane protease PrsW [Microaerobacter geothermalis]
MFSLITAAIAPGIALLSYFYLKDKYEMEPLRLVVRQFIFGVLLVFPIVVLQRVFSSWLTFPYLDAILAGALLEEFFKWFIIYYTVFTHVEFDEPYDGIVYAVAVSLGFASMENFIYLLNNGLSIAWIRAFLPVSGHALFAVVMGYYLGKAKFTTRKKKFLLLSLLYPFILHSMFNLILTSNGIWYISLIIPFMFVLWWIGLRRVKMAHHMVYHANSKNMGFGQD